MTAWLRFEERGFAFESDGGELLDGHGYELRDEHDRLVRWDDRRLAAAGADVVKVAGATYRPDALAEDAFAPGSALALVPEPENPHDAGAVGVWDAARRLQAGYVPRALSSRLAERLAHGEALEAISLWEWRDERGRRCGLRVLVCPADLLRERPAPLAR